MLVADDILFESDTPIGLKVRVTKIAWERIPTQKHPVMMGKEDLVKAAIHDPDENRRSKSDETVYLFYRLFRSSRWICAVVKELTGMPGFLITAYLTDAIKEGEGIWSK